MNKNKSNILKNYKKKFYCFLILFLKFSFVLVSPSVHSVPEDGDLEVKLGDEVEMACIAKGFPYPSLSWYMKVLFFSFYNFGKLLIKLE